MSSVVTKDSPANKLILQEETKEHNATEALTSDSYVGIMDVSISLDVGKTNINTSVDMKSSEGTGDVISNLVATTTTAGTYDSKLLHVQVGEEGMSIADKEEVGDITDNNSLGSLDNPGRSTDDFYFSLKST